MSHEASGWAFRQDLPAKVKMVLVALADQASETNGHVCYGQRHMKFLARKSACSERTLYRYLAALVRNGYLVKDSGKEKGRESELYLQLDRDPTMHGKWAWKIGDPEADEPQDIVGGMPKEDVENADRNGIPPAPHGVTPPLPHRVADNRNLNTNKELRATDEKPTKGFSRQAQEVEMRERRERTQAFDLGEMPGFTFIIEGTRWWSILIAHRRSVGRPINRTDPGIGKYKGKTGRYIKTEEWEKILKSPSTAPPPVSADGVDERAAQEFADCNR